ncbi:TRAP transporter small permease subunit [Thermoflexibacter ruber]|uniref:TRAP-type mannitol/chloroaromatic compound transport system, small permease component n=1 Tax=Thermoflexibacter ruber TaxID=1003 RepID=A0A1I2IHU9_9BACT|nr:TRAP transporter small permease subunit [Thermoflexibacter ruber]SFF40416.1 TRAP-type mannitol/chloroaromatic compound transport system, small permease component [Thermoflexibacter ruber]
MLKFLSYSAKQIDALNERIGRITAWLTTLLVLLFCYDVLMRYVFNATNVAIFELEWHLFAIIFLVGAGYTLKHDRHVRVDVLYAKFPPKKKAYINLLGCLLFLLPFCFIIFKGAIPYIQLSWRIGEGSSDAGGLPYRFVIKSFMFLGFALLSLQAISMAFKSLLIIFEENQVEK